MSDAPEIPPELAKAQNEWMEAMDAAAEAIPTVYHNRLLDMENAHARMMLAVMDYAGKHQMLMAARQGTDTLTKKPN